MKTEESATGRVLVVDDDPDVRRDFTRLLRRLGIEVVTATDGWKAFESFSADTYDVIVSDISMPNLGGLQFLRAIRGVDLEVPVVLVTGQPSFETAVKAIEYGATRYLVKPVDPAAFEEVVQRSIHLRRLARLKRAVSDLPDVHGLKLGDRASLEARFSSALDKVWIAFQPIVRLSSRSVLGYEALVRSSEASLPGPADLFDAAGRLGRVEDLARKIREVAATSFEAAPKTALLFVNVHAEELNDEELYSSGAALSARAGRTVLEITERSALDGVQGLSTRLARLRKLGFKLAVDDLGAGYAGLASFSRIEPEWVKLDMSLIRGIDRLSRKRSLVRGMAEICSRDLGIQVICEGVEQPDERDVLAADGLDFLQGFLFARPAAGFPAPAWGSMAPEIDRAAANR
jgi:EAL domain-containing protein (putative c-di-GMP-specific phosphodiesterase class I)/ActR/RegA family two-component response regulator